MKSANISSTVTEGGRANLMIDPGAFVPRGRCHDLGHGEGGV